jgi:hypothetical protein
MYILVVVCLLVSCLASSVVADETRLNCLQFQQGKELKSTPWTRGYVSSDKTRQKQEAWVYNNTKCPLEQFNEEKFCNQAIRCGKHMLLVGDSTVQRLASAVRHVLTTSVQFGNCPTANFCSKKPPECLPKEGHNEQVRTYTVCENYCPTQLPVRITYIRHDYLTNIHANRNFWSAICEYWKTVARAVDYLLISTGPHIDGMLRHPYGLPPPPNFNELDFFQREANATTELVRNLMAPKATLIYRTGAIGLLNYSKNCDLHPHDSPPEIHSKYNWDKIPRLNEAYIQALRTGIPAKERSVLIMDAATLFTKLQGCRTDHLHYEENTPVTPVLLEWVILQNLLIEHHATRGR